MRLYKLSLGFYGHLFIAFVFISRKCIIMQKYRLPQFRPFWKVKICDWGSKEKKRKENKEKPKKVRSGSLGERATKKKIEERKGCVLYYFSIGILYIYFRENDIWFWSYLLKRKFYLVTCFKIVCKNKNSENIFGYLRKVKLHCIF